MAVSSESANALTAFFARTYSRHSSPDNFAARVSPFGEIVYLRIGVNLSQARIREHLSFASSTFVPNHSERNAAASWSLKIVARVWPTRITLGNSAFFLLLLDAVKHKQNQPKRP
jgi:hypothetical protein